MFRGGQPNPYDEIVGKTTDENLTGENWELILNLCDKVQDEGEQGARNIVASVLKRLAHRNPNVQLYTLTLAESLSKNCGIEVHREIASRAFTQGLEKLVTDRTAHEKVRRRVLSLVAMWTAEFEKDPTLGIMEECYESLKSKGYKFEAPEEAPPPDVDDEVRRREEEELQRVLEMSMHDKGGRAQWGQYSLAAPGSSSGSGLQPGTASNAAKPPSASPAPSPVAHRNGSYAQQPVYGGYVPSSSPAISTEPSHSSSSTVTSVTTTSASASSPASTHSAQDSIPVVTRVRALHTFEPTEPGELPFEKGDIIKVVDRGYKDWWRGQLKGRTGIFPVNYVEPLPEPTPAELVKEVEQEAAVFGQAANVDRLLTMLRAMDPVKDNLADNEEIQELYRSCMSLRPKIVKLIDKYSQKRAELVAMNESFVKARTIFDRMMEDSLARHTGIYDGRGPYPPQSQPYITRPDSRGRNDAPPPGAPQAYGWNPTLYDQPGYSAYPAPAAAYAPGLEANYPGPAPPQPFVDPNAYAQRRQSVYPQQPPYPGQPAPYPPQQEHQGYPGPQPAVHPQTAPQPQGAIPPQSELAPQPQPTAQPHAQGQPQAQQQQQQAAAGQSGPPYIFDPNATYADPNVQAWAQYYAQGGKDLTGTVYFLSVPGIKEGPAPIQAARSASQETVHQQQQQQQPHSPVVESTQPAAAAPYNAFGGSSGDLQSYPGQQSQFSSESALAGALGSAPLHVQQVPEQSSQPHISRTSPTAQQPPQQQFYQASGSSPNASFHGAAPAHQQPPPTSQESYGASAYNPAGYPQQATSPTAGDGNAQQQGWQQQYYSLPNQFAGMEVSGEGHQTAGPQGVGAPA
ncbi:hypothetical protein OBBRIDRAFT_718848 [Obba rivulosa]|uniref:Class E vacuolar protein-sorting machinery protein HSE1 n=1 Tax=Obba rivulosa TaxID=1052685 RepID=A0A8E2DVG7_9APHY|nr:hypothetical protein OBBRIDRAFT_718848 [Obba rivulosa]